MLSLRKNQVVIFLKANERKEYKAQALARQRQLVKDMGNRIKIKRLTTPKPPKEVMDAAMEVIEQFKEKAKPEELGKQIKKVREDVAQITQKDLADYLGVQASTISQYENGISQPDLARLIEIAAYLRTTVDSLLGLNYSDDDWAFVNRRYTRDLKSEELEEVAKFTEAFQDIFVNIKPEGRKLLEEFAKVVNKMYRRDYQKEGDVAERIAENEAEESDHIRRLEERADTANIYEWAELNKAGLIMVVDTQEEAREYNTGKKPFPSQYSKVMSKEFFKRNEEAYNQQLQELLKHRPKIIQQIGEPKKFSIETWQNLKSDNEKRPS